MDIGKVVEVTTIDPIFIPRRKVLPAVPERRQPVQEPDREPVLVPVRRKAA